MADPVTTPAELSVGDEVDLVVRAVASGGAGVADLPDGRAVFVHGTAPGDRVRARVTRLRPRWGRAALTAVVEPGPERVAPPCPNFGRCGGCTLQHLEAPAQHAWKARFVRDALERIAGIEAPLPEVVPSPRTRGYRNRVTFTLRTLRGGRVVAGFHALEDPDRIVDVGTECLLPEAPILAAWGALRAAMERGESVLPRARELRVTVRALADGQVAILVRGGAPGWDAAPLPDVVAGLVGVWHHAEGAPGPIRILGVPAWEGWDEDRFPIAGHAFLQVNREAGRALAAHVLAQAPAAPGRAVDAYCGVGVYGRALARRGWSVRGIELDADACEGARSEAPEGFTVVEGRVEERLARLLPVDLVVLNPPRTGLHEDVAERLRERPPPTLIYVSCDPATLARDLGRLGGTWTLEGLRAFDLFPHTSHVETVAVLRARPSSQEGTG